MHKIMYSTDRDGDKWKEETLANYSSKDLTYIMIQNYFCKLTMEGNFLDERNISIYISINQITQKDFGFLLEINVKQLFTVGNKLELNNCTKSIIRLCKDIYYKTQYQYAFCDHEVDIEYSWDEFISLNEPMYSISIIPKKNNFDINLAS